MIKPPETVLLRIQEDNKVKQCLAYGEHSILGGDGGGGGSHSNNNGDHTGRVRTRELPTLCCYSPQRILEGIPQELYLVARKLKGICLEMNSYIQESFSN